MTTIEKLTKLRAHMAESSADILLVPSDDYHQSEYVGDFFRSRAYISGFTGSAGTLVITKDEAKLFTDGRYFIQAARQLEGSTIELMKSGTEGVPTPTDYIASLLKDESKGFKTVAFDGKCVSAKFADALEKKLPEGASLITDIDFPALIWAERPALPASKIWKLSDSYSGRTHAEKLSDVRSVIKDKGCDALVMSSLCDTAWLYNLRGGDVTHTPVFLSYTIITEAEDKLFVSPEAVADVKAEIDAEGVTVHAYGDFYSELAKLSGKTVMIDKNAVSHAIVTALCDCKIIDAQNPTVILKAKKNSVELENTRKAHITDGLALTKMMLELKYTDNIGDELQAEKRLIELRRECAQIIGTHYLEESFGAICAFGANAAMAHYSASPESYSRVDKNAPVPMLLIDSGGLYLEGTTDTTRTFVLGNISEEIKKHYTLTVMGNMRLASLNFLEGITGKAIDIICRAPLWDNGIDYRHGTGHGVGHVLSVHEGPNNIHWGRPDTKFEVGMITSDEPGVYVEGSHGIRIENELVCQNGEKGEYGQFMYFENITFCPIDLDGIDTKYMEAGDIKRLNDYHKSVYDKLSPYLTDNERQKLSHLTRAI